MIYANMFRLVCTVQCIGLVLGLTSLDTEDAMAKVRVAHAASQDVVSDVWDRDAPQVTDLLCSAPKKIGHITKDSNISNCLVMPPGTIVEQSRAENIPIYAGCLVYVSKAWKFIYVRNPKSSSTALIHAIRHQLCGADECADEQFQRVDSLAELEPLWEEYFVFTIVRNPWTRALSAFSMFTEHFLFKVPETPDQAPTQHCGVGFDEFASSAYALRRVCEAEDCCAHVAGELAAGFVDIHIADQAHCAFLPLGQSIVDYIGSSEDLAQSWRDIVEAINARIGTDFVAEEPYNPNGRGGEETHGVQHTCDSEKALKHYNEKTVKDVALHFAEDVVRFGYV